MDSNQMPAASTGAADRQPAVRPTRAMVHRMQQWSGDGPTRSHVAATRDDTPVEMLAT